MSSASWRILVPLDDSPQALRALEYVKALGRAARCQVKLIRTSDPEADSGTHSLASYAADLQQAGIEVESTTVDSANAAAVIVDAARAWPADVIVMATRRWSGIDRWLNDSVTDAVVRSASTPVLVLPPDLEKPVVVNSKLRIVVPLDGSRVAEQALGPVARFSAAAFVDPLLMRAVDREQDCAGAREYLGRVASQVESGLGRPVTTRAVTQPPAQAILEEARAFVADLIAMATHGRIGLARALSGSTATAVLEASTVPLLLLGPAALTQPTTAEVRLREPVRTVDGEQVGEVHRVVVDLDQRAVAGVVVLGRGALARDVLVPVDFIDSVKNGEVRLRLTSEELDRLPDVMWREFVTPPPTWTSFVPWLNGPSLIPAIQRTRLGPTQQDITPGTPVVGIDGTLGSVDRVEVDEFGQIAAMVVREDRPLGADLRIPVEWVQAARTGEDGLHVAATRAEVEAYLRQANTS